MSDCDERRILLLSAGGSTGTYLTKHLKKIMRYYLVGCDIKTDVPLREQLDAFYDVPSVNSDNYEKAIKDIIEKERITAILPLTSYDMTVYSRGKLYEGYKDRMLIMPYHSLIRYHDKKLCMEHLKQLGICVPEQYTPDGLKYPLLLKERISSGSKKCILCEDNRDYLYWKKKLEKCIITEFLPGDEYTVDCLFDKAGKCVGYNTRKRVAVNGGGAVICQNDDNEKVKSVISTLEKTRELIGAVNFQFKYKDREVCIFDFNPRFASGGLPLTVASGFDIPNMLISLIYGNKVNVWKRPESENGKMMYRYYEEMFR